MWCGTSWSGTLWMPTTGGRRCRTRSRRCGIPDGPGRSGRRDGDDDRMSIEIANESGVAVDEPSIVAAARFALDRLGVSKLAELSVMLVELDVMADLHERWMELPGPTDVMAFPMDELDSARRPDAADAGPALLGDVVLCPAFARDQARQAGHSLIEE